MGNWDALSIQLVWFAADARHTDAAALYTSIFGADPDNFQKNKTPTPGAPQLSIAAGVVDDFAYQLMVQAGRVDLMAQRHQGEGVEGPVPIAGTDKVITELSRRAAVIGEGLRGVTRLALVTTLIAPAANHLEANEKVAEQIGVKLPRHDVTDLMFQLNLRKPIVGFTDTAMNRLVKFGVAGFQSITVEIGPQAVVTPHTVQNYAASLSIDTNTVPRLTPFSSEEQKMIWSSLAAETNKLRADGSLGGLWNA